MPSSLIRRAATRRGAVAMLAVFALVAAGCSSAPTVATSTSTTASTTSSASSTGTSSTSGSSSSSTSSSSASCVPKSGATSTAATSSAGGAAGDAKTAKSAAELGGMSGLEAAAKKEGALNVIALPHDWANYGEILTAFAAKYPEIKINEQNPGGSSADEIAAATTNKGTDVAPDVFDLGTSVALASTANFAPYQVAAWDSIPAERKEPTGLWVNDYTGTMTIGYDSTNFGEITKMSDLLDPKLKGVVALNGNPTTAGSAFNGVVMASLANGGSLDDIAPGVDFFLKVKQAGNLFTGDVTNETVKSGASAVVFDWSYNQVGYVAGLKAEGVDWKLFVPEGANLGSYYNQAINVDAPHPAAARLWEEFLYSPDAQNMWLKGGANPVLQQAMIDNCTINQDYLKVMGSDAVPKVQTTAQAEKAAAYLKANWSKVGG